LSAITTRDRIVEAADDLIYRQGYSHTSFSDIATAVQISRGNFYHHFKSKDEILDAVIDGRLSDTKLMLDQWEVAGEQPQDRIISFIEMMVVNGPLISKYGCPVGTLSTELAKMQHPSEPKAAGLFALFLSWLAGQFASLGREDNADTLAMHLLVRSQGVAVLAQALGDEDFIDKQVSEMRDWLSSTLEQGSI